MCNALDEYKVLNVYLQKNKKTNRCINTYINTWMSARND